MATRASGRRTSGARTTKRLGAGTRKTSMTAKLGGKKSAHRAAYIAGTAVVAAGVIAAVLLLKNKSAQAQPNGGPPPPPPNPTNYTPLQQAAVAMNSAIDVNSYAATDRPIYSAFQSAAGLTADGWPGQGTYRALIAALASAGVAPSANLNPNYTFAPFNAQTGAGGFNGVTAPTAEAFWGPAAAGQPASYTG